MAHPLHYNELTEVTVNILFSSHTMACWNNQKGEESMGLDYTVQVAKKSLMDIIDIKSTNASKDHYASSYNFNFIIIPSATDVYTSS